MVGSLPTQARNNQIDVQKLQLLGANGPSGGRTRPVSLAAVMRTESIEKANQEATATSFASRGKGVSLTWDWVLLTTATNFNLKGDTTWYVSGPVTLSASGSGGGTTIEGGTVVKFTNTPQAQIVVSGPIFCQTRPYRMAGFTSKDDNAIGQKITGGTGTPVGYYGYGLFIYNSSTLHDLRFLYANTAITLIGQQTLALQDSQFVKCLNAFSFYDHTTANVENSLFYQLDTWATGGQQYTTVNGVNLTIHNCATLSSLGVNSSVNLTNTILIPVPTFGSGTINTDPNTTPTDLTSDFGFFQTVGSGAHYLQYANSIRQIRDAGTMDISPALIARLSQKTTLPPAVLTTNFTATTTLVPVVPRDDDGRIDLGFHYDVLDFAWSALDLTNTTLTLTNGVAVGAYGANGTTLRRAAQFVSEGGPVKLNHVARYQSVQEGPAAWGTTNPSGFIMSLSSSTPDVEFRFTDLSFLSGGGSLVGVGGYNVISPLAIANCQIQGLNLNGLYAYSPGIVINLTNNWIERCPMSFYEENIPGYYPITLNFFNNLFHGGTYGFNDVSGQHTFTVYDNLFDADSVSGANVLAGWNGFRTGLGSPLGGSGNVTGLTPDYQTGLLGTFYYPTAGGNLSRLINAGSRSAPTAGLSAYTTTTDQVPEGSSTVDIGYHSFAVNPSTVVTIQATQPLALEPPNGVNGQFTVTRTGSTAASLTVYYAVGGTAVPGTDYAALPGSVTLGIGSSSQEFPVLPLDNNTVTFDKTVVASLILNGNYLVGAASEATVKIQDSDLLTGVVPAATINDPVGIDYSPTTNSLLISANANIGGLPNVFYRLSVLGGSQTLNTWSSASGFGADAEVKLTIVKTSTNGWAQGDTYFATGNHGQIGWISADGNSVNNNWLTLSGEPNPIGGLYVDQTGVFGGDLIVVSGASASGGGIWRITAGKTATKLAQINDASGTGVDCEGVVTVPNSQGQYGPWAGKILTCGETAHLVFTFDVSGKINPYDLGLYTPEDVRLIPSGQNLYCADASSNLIRKVPQANFSQFVGDVIFVNEAIASPSALFDAHWTGGEFVIRHLSVGSSFEQVTFAPIDIPGQ